MGLIKFLFLLSVVSAVGWLVSVVLSRLLFWFLSQMMGISVDFQVAGFNCIKDVLVTFKKGSIGSVSIAEIRLGFSFVSEEQKLQLMICDIELLLRPSSRSSKKKKKSRKSKRPVKSGIWTLACNTIRFLSVSITELKVKVPKASVEVKDLTLNASKCGSDPNLNINLQIMHSVFNLLDLELTVAQSSDLNHESFTVEGPTSLSTIEKSFSPFMSQGLSITCELGHNKEQGIKVLSLDFTCEGIVIDLRDNLFPKKKIKSADNKQSADSSSEISEKSEKRKFSPLSLEKHILVFPEKVSLNMARLDVKFMHQGQDLFANNGIVGLQLRSTKSKSYDNSGKAFSQFDFFMDFGEIYLLGEGTDSVLKILNLAVITTIHVPLQDLPIKAEIDVKLGGIQCNLIFSRISPWLRLLLSKKKPKPMVLNGEDSNDGRNLTDREPTERVKVIVWSCTVSMSKMTIILYSSNDLPLYNGLLQSFHLSANNIESIQGNSEVGEFQLSIAEECLQTITDKSLGDVRSGCVLHIEKLCLDLGHKQVSPDEHDHTRLKLVLNVDIVGIGVFLCFQNVESLIKIVSAFKGLKESNSPGIKPVQKGIQTSKKSKSKGPSMFIVSLGKFCLNYHGETSLIDMTIADPKRVNFGSQGGEVIISVSADGTPRTARIISSQPSGSEKLKFSTSFDILHLRLRLDKEKHSSQIEVERAKSIYQEYPEEQNPGTEVTLLDIQKAKFVRRSGNENALRSLLYVTDVSFRWEPDVHIALLECVSCLKSLLHNQKLMGAGKQMTEEPVNTNMASENEITLSQSSKEKQQKKRESVFAIDVEMLKISAGLGDGVEALIHVQSIFSENIKIGVLLEEVILKFNDARILRSSRLQISRIPVTVPQNLSESKAQAPSIWDWVIQIPDVYICMPYKLELRAIDDVVEETLRGLKLIGAAQRNLILPDKKPSVKKPKSKSVGFGSVRLVIRKLTVEIEEEPLQGWLDEHHQMMRTEVCQAAVRSKFLHELSDKLAKGSEPNELDSNKKIHFQGNEVDPSNSLSIQMLEEEIHKRVFRSYYKACQKLVKSEGSGACISGFQSGFKPSANRTSVLSIHAEEFDVTLTVIPGGGVGMIEFIKKVDPVAADKDIPFSRMYGSDFALAAGSLAVKLRNYTYPIFSATSAKCKGRLVLAQQATAFQPQIVKDVFIGRWWTVQMLRSASGTTPAMKTYLDLPLSFQKGEVSYGVGYEPVFTDISYAFTVALRRANLGPRTLANPPVQQPKKEKSLPWWDEVRNYIHGTIGLSFMETKWHLLGTINPYENLDKMEIVSGYMEIKQRDGHVSLSTQDIKVYMSSLESLVKSYCLRPPHRVVGPVLASPAFYGEVFIEWECESGNPYDHYLFALPVEGKSREIVFDPFRSTSLSFKWGFSLKQCLVSENQLASPSNIARQLETERSVNGSSEKYVNKSNFPAINFAAHDLVWLFRWWNLVYLPPQKLRTFSRWPRFGVPRVPRSGNLALDKVMTENYIRLDSTPLCIIHMPLRSNDAANGLTLKTENLKYEMYFSRGRQKFTFDSVRGPLDLGYQGLDLHLLKAYLDHDTGVAAGKDKEVVKNPQSTVVESAVNNKNKYDCTEKKVDDGFLLSFDYVALRRQASKADPVKLLAWQESYKKTPGVRSSRCQKNDGSESDHALSDASDDDGFNVVVADNCQRVFIYGLKILWTIENRDAVCSCISGISKAFEPPKPSPSRLYNQRKLLEKQESLNAIDTSNDEISQTASSISCSESPSAVKQVENDGSGSSDSPAEVENSSTDIAVKHGNTADSKEEVTCHFMVNIIQPQFNLHSEEANGRFLLAAASGRVLARSFQSLIRVGSDVIGQALSTSMPVLPNAPELAWNRTELSVMLEHVQAHVAPTDVDPGAGIQWLPKILRGSPQIKRTGALLEGVFTPCQMYFRHTQHKSGTSELKVKPLKELTFNSPNITAAMTSRQFQVMMDVLTNLIFARLPKPLNNSLPYSSDDDNEDDTQAVLDEVVPDGIEEVDLARIDLEKKDRECKLLIDDIKALQVAADVSEEISLHPDNCQLWMVSGVNSTLIQGLRKELSSARLLRKEGSAALAVTLQETAQLRLMEKEKNKSPSFAMRVSIKINKVVWSMLADSKAFAEAEINDMLYDFDRDYKDIGVALLTVKSLQLRNCLPNVKSDIILSAWNPPAEWGKSSMLRVDAKQGAPKDGSSPIEHLQVEIYPLKIYLTETMYRMMWEYLFPGEDNDSLKRQEVWKISTTSNAKKGKKSSSSSQTSSSSQVTKDSEVRGKSSKASKTQNPKSSNASGGNSKLRRTSSFDRTWEESIAESIANELVMQSHSSSIPAITGSVDTAQENKLTDPKSVKAGRVSIEDKKAGKIQEEKKPSNKKMKEFHNIRISQVELLITYEGSRFNLSDRKFLMDAFHRDDFTGTWSRLFSRVKKHVIWGAVKSFAGMQGKKFKDKGGLKEDKGGLKEDKGGLKEDKGGLKEDKGGPKEAQGGRLPENDLNMSDSDGDQPERSDQFHLAMLQKSGDGAGDGFVTSIRGLFNSQRRKAKAFVLRTMRGDEDGDLQGELSENDAGFSPFARQLTITKTKKLIRKHTKKFSRAEKNSGSLLEEEQLSPKEAMQSGSDSSGPSSREGGLSD